MSKKRIDPQEFVEKYNKNVPSMPLDFALTQELLKIIFSALQLSPRASLYKKLLSSLLSKLDSSSNAFEFTRLVSEVKISDILSDEEVKNFYFLSIPESSIPADDALEESEASDE